METAFLWVITQRVVVIPCRRLGQEIDKMSQNVCNELPLAENISPFGKPQYSTEHNHYKATLQTQGRQEWVGNPVKFLTPPHPTAAKANQLKIFTI
jgi:hypothetical protein